VWTARFGRIVGCVLLAILDTSYETEVQ
jgi:hypothetical protein